MHAAGEQDLVPVDVAHPRREALFEQHLADLGVGIRERVDPVEDRVEVDRGSAQVGTEVVERAVADPAELHDRGPEADRDRPVHPEHRPGEVAG